MGSTSMRLLFVLTLAAGAASLTASEVSGFENPGLCCICSDCRSTNSTTSGFGAGNTVCLEVAEPDCKLACDNLGCGAEEFVATECNDPSLAAQCNDTGVMAPTASPLGLIGLAALLTGGGVFYLRRRRA